MDSIIYLSSAYSVIHNILSTSTEYTVSLEWLNNVCHGLGVVTDSPMHYFMQSCRMCRGIRHVTSVLRWVPSVYQKGEAGFY